MPLSKAHQLTTLKNSMYFSIPDDLIKGTCEKGNVTLKNCYKCYVTGCKQRLI